MLIAEDLLLLLLDDVKGTVPTGVDLRPVLGGAVLTELALSGAVGVGEKKGFWATAKVYVDPEAALPEDATLAAAVGMVGERERSAQDLVGRLGKGLREVLLARLEQVGILRRQQSKVLGLFLRTTWPASDVAHERQVREAIQAALVQGVTPDERTAALISLLHACGQAHKVVALDGLPARQVKARAQHIAEGAWAAQAVKDAIDAAIAATTAAVVAATAASSAATSSST